MMIWREKKCFPIFFPSVSDLWVVFVLVFVSLVVGITVRWQHISLLSESNARHRTVSPDENDWTKSYKKCVLMNVWRTTETTRVSAAYHLSSHSLHGLICQSSWPATTNKVSDQDDGHKCQQSCSHCDRNHVVHIIISKTCVVSNVFRVSHLDGNVFEDHFLLFPVFRCLSHRVACVSGSAMFGSVAQEKVLFAHIKVVCLSSFCNDCSELETPRSSIFTYHFHRSTSNGLLSDKKGWNYQNFRNRIGQTGEHRSSKWQRCSSGQLRHMIHRPCQRFPGSGTPSCYSCQSTRIVQQTAPSDTSYPNPWL